MTSLGKILVFINLLFSLLTGALIIMTFVTRTNWRTGYDEAVAQLDKERVRVGIKESQIKEVENHKNKEIIDLQDKVKQAVAEFDRLTKERDDARAKANVADQQVAILSGTISKSNSVIEGLKAEIETLDKRLVAEQERVLKYGLENKAFKAETIKARTDLETALERNAQLLAKLVEADKKIQVLEGEASAKAGREIKNPPPEDVRGKVTAADDNSGFVTINLGSDNGLSKGNTLEVFRLRPRPTYVGTLRVYDVRPNEAVGKLMGTGPKGRILKDDEVASKILGSP